MTDIFGSDVEANDPAVIPAPDVDLSQPIYADTPESQAVPAVNWYDDDDETEPSFEEYVMGRLSSIETNMEALLKSHLGTESQITHLKTGVNTIGEMMNSVAAAADEIMTKVRTGGIGSLLGSVMGGKNNGD